MITGKKNLLVAALEVVAVGIFLKIGYHLGGKLIEKVEGPKPLKKKKDSESRDMDDGGGRKRAVEGLTDTNLNLLP